MARDGLGPMVEAMAEYLIATEQRLDSIEARQRHYWQHDPQCAHVGWEGYGPTFPQCDCWLADMERAGPS